MTSIREFVRRRFAPVTPLPAGMYHYQAPPDDPRNFRLHLRLEADGSGLLVVNASTVLHLNQTASEYAYHMIQRTPPENAARQVANRYRVRFQQALSDYQDFVDRIETLIETPDLDPETFLDFERLTPYEKQVSAPLRLDCALTYRLPEGVEASYAPLKRVDRELSTEEWNTILDKAWAAGIPHVVFTGGEPTLRADLTAIIQHAEANGQVSGLISDGLRMADPDYLNLLLQTGLDHLLMIFLPDTDLSWAALDQLLPADLFVAVHLTLTPANVATTPDLLRRLAKKGLKYISLSASDLDLTSNVNHARNLAAEMGMSLVWNLPVPYSTQHPVALETAQDQPPTGAGKAWLYVEPDGDVLPAQGVNQVMGNFLRDPWESIWKMPA